MLKGKTMVASTVSSILELTLGEMFSDGVTERSEESKKACPHCGGDISWLA